MTFKTWLLTILSIVFVGFAIAIAIAILVSTNSSITEAFITPERVLGLSYLALGLLIFGYAQFDRLVTKNRREEEEWENDEDIME
jgi:uncharacterized membrane protein YidH (DUF202 family)